MEVVNEVGGIRRWGQTNEKGNSKCCCKRGAEGLQKSRTAGAAALRSRIPLLEETRGAFGRVVVPLAESWGLQALGT